MCLFRCARFLTSMLDSREQISDLIGVPKGLETEIIINIVKSINKKDRLLEERLLGGNRRDPSILDT